MSEARPQFTAMHYVTMILFFIDLILLFVALLQVDPAQLSDPGLCPTCGPSGTALPQLPERNKSK